MSISVTRVQSGYPGFHLDDVSVEIAAGSFTALIGPNGCGKSTLLKTISAELAPGGGQVKIGGEDLATLRPRAISKRIAVLPQNPDVPLGITVETLVGYGRAPHQNLMGIKSKADIKAVEHALHTVDLLSMRDRPLNALSGGQRQRAFIAMCLAQDTPYILLDEPTSFLDIRYQYDVLDLLARLNAQGKTLVAVLHDIGQAARYASDIVVMKSRAIYASGPPDHVITADMLRAVYAVEAEVFPDPVTATALLSRVPAPCGNTGYSTLAEAPQ
ncbi:MAG: ABC transporter ATP-binding protein [Pseudomonadota bacterium]